MEFLSVFFCLLKCVLDYFYLIVILMWLVYIIVNSVIDEKIRGRVLFLVVI